MSDYLERFQNRKKRMKTSTLNSLNSDSQNIKDLKEQMLSQKMNINWEEIDQKDENYCKPRTEISESEIKELLNFIDNEFNAQRFNSLLNDTKKNILDNMIKPFGLATVLFEDQDGGNVTTTHNFEKGILATENDQKSYQEYQDAQKQPFDRKPYEKEFPKKRKEIFKSNDQLKDGYTGKVLSKDGKSHLDHITSAHEVDMMAKSHLYMEKNSRVDMANDSDNLIMTDSSLNQSKSDKDPKEWANHQNAKDKTKTNAEKYDLDNELFQKQYNQSKDHIKRTQNKKQFKKQSVEIAQTGAREGLQMGTQQALGLMLREFVGAIFTEVKDIFKSGFKLDLTDSWFQAIKKRLTTIGTKVLSKWKSFVQAFKEGVISGFFSNIITVVINSFYTTLKNMVRIIREGFFSLVKAIKLAIFPPENMTRKQALHESTKLIATGVIIAGGIALEEIISKYFDSFLAGVPVLNTFKDSIIMVIMGLLTGLTSSIAVYFIDKMDLFGVIKEERHLFIMGCLDQKITQNINECKSIIQDITFT